jgi:hypothetical protein
MDLPPGWHLSIEDRPSPAARNRLGSIKSTGFGRGGSIEAKRRSSLFLTLCWREMDSNFQFLVAKGCVLFGADDGPAKTRDRVYRVRLRHPA